MGPLTAPAIRAPGSRPPPIRWGLLGLLVVMAAPLHGQGTGQLRGTVRDQVGQPLAGAEVVLAGVTRTATTGASGQFRFDSLPQRQFALTARLPGYAAARLTVDLSETGFLELDLRLERLPQVIDSIVVSGSRRGLYGVVGTAALHPVAGARVDVLGGGVSQVTDSTGRFAFPDLKPGTYVVLADHPFLAGRPLHVTVPRNGSREVVLFVGVAGSGEGEAPGMKWVYHDLGTRLAFQPASRRMTRDELARARGRQLCDIARVRAAVSTDYPTIVVNGVDVLTNWPLCSFEADELTLVEWGACTSATGPVQRIGAMTRRPGTGRSGRVSCIMVWTR